MSVVAGVTEVNLSHVGEVQPREGQVMSSTGTPPACKDPLNFSLHGFSIQRQGSLSKDHTIFPNQVRPSHLVAPSSDDVIMLTPKALSLNNIHKAERGATSHQSGLENKENSPYKPMKGKTWKRKARDLSSTLLDVTNKICKPPLHTNAKRPLREKTSTRANLANKKQKQKLKLD